MRNNYKKLFVIFIFIITLITSYIIITSGKKEEISNNRLNGEYQKIYKKYGINEYSVINITDEQLTKIYLNDFKYYLFNNENKLYLLLNEEYRNIKFGSFDVYKEYLERFKNLDLEIIKYSVSYDKKFIEISLISGYKLIFKIKNIYDYELYFDDYTVEINIK